MAEPEEAEALMTQLSDEESGSEEEEEGLVDRPKN